VTGDTVNVAARLEQAAPAYEVLIGEPTYRLVRDHVEVEEVEPLELKGKSERVPAYRLLSVTEGAVERRHTLPLVGRERELALLTGLLDDAVAEKSCRLVNVMADAGTGKSRLIEEVMSLASERGGKALRGRCLQYGSGITFWPLIEIVGEAAGITRQETPDVATEKIAAIVEDPDVIERVAAAVGLSEAQFPLDELYWGARKLLEAIAASGPLVAVFEDLHWAEPALLDLLTNIAQTSSGAPVLVVGTARPQLADINPDWPDPDVATRISLEPLDGEAVDRLVEHMLGGTLPAEVLAKIAAAAEGNPLFVEQLVAMFVDEGALHREGDGWVAVKNFEERVTVPASIDALLAGRLDLLPRDELTVLESASVIGLNFPVEPVEEIVPAALVPVRPHIGRIESRGLVRAAEDADIDVFRFHHILVRDSAYNRLPKRIRATLHARFARWGERVNRERGRELEFQEIMGFHLEEARRYLLELAPLDEEGRELGRRAAGHLAPAGRRAFGRGDMAAAANLLRRAADLLPEDSFDRLELLPDLGEALMEAGEFAAAQERLDEAVAGAAALGDTTLEADAILTRLRIAHYTLEDLDDWRVEVQRETDRLIPALEGGDAPSVLAKAWLMVAFVHATVCRWQEAADALERAISYDRQADDARKLARHSASYVMALSEGPTPAPVAIERAQEVLDYGLVDRGAEAIIMLSIAPLHAMSGDFDRARELTNVARAVLQDLGATVTAARTSDSTARIELMAGDPEAAEAKLRADYEALTAMQERYVLPNIAALLAKTLIELGRLDDAEAIADIAEELAGDDDIEAQVELRAVRARLAAAAGRAEDARTLAREAVELTGQTDSPVLRADTLLEVAEVFEGPDGERRAALEEARALYRQKAHRVGMARVDEALAEGVPV
jgi:tetratricopeptide (TPR) repeat protein